MNLDLDHLRQFSEVAKHASFRAAAASLKMPVATLSRHIRDLEDQLGERLFNRTKTANQKLAAAVADRMVKRATDEVTSKLQVQKMAFDSALEDHRRATARMVRSTALRAAIAGASIGVLAAVLAASLIR